MVSSSEADRDTPPEAELFDARCANKRPLDPDPPLDPDLTLDTVKGAVVPPGC
jgi:hypothetical protein